MGLGEILAFVRDEPSQKFTSSLIKNIKCSRGRGLVLVVTILTIYNENAVGR